MSAEEENRINRRDFLKIAGKVAVGMGIAAGGFEIGRTVERANIEHPEITGDKPLDVQIREFETAHGFKGFEDIKFRNRYTWLLSQWYANNFTFGLLDDPVNPYAAANKIYNAVSYITDPKDNRLTREFAGMTLAGIYILIDLTQKEFQSKTPNYQEKIVPPVISLRDTLSHEMTHFITLKNEDDLVIKILEKSTRRVKNVDVPFLHGFSVYIDIDNPELNDFDEAVTELLGNYYQRNSLLPTVKPSYLDATSIMGEKSKVEKSIDELNGILIAADISVNRLAIFHAMSDLDGFCISLSDATTRTFTDKIEKVSYGLSIIDALGTADQQVLGSYRMDLKKSDGHTPKG